MKTQTTVPVLFVCLGNICRSPAAEGVFRHLVQETGNTQRIVIDSAGTIGYHTGNSPDERMSEAAASRGYTLCSAARQVVAEDIENHELIIAMDHDNLIELEKLAGGPRPQIRLLGTFLESFPECGADNSTACAVPDPYYGGQEGFERVLDMLEEAASLMLEHCLELYERKNADRAKAGTQKML